MKPLDHRPRIITSRNHAAIRRIRDLHFREERDRSGLFLIEGIRFVLHAMERRVPVRTLIVSTSLLVSPAGRKLLRQQQRAGTPCLEVPPEVFQSLAQGDEPQGIAAVVPQQWSTLAEVDPRAGLCWLVLGTVQSPGNLGSILRTSEAVGGAGVIFLDRATDPYDAATVRASMGALFAQHLVRASPAELAAWKSRHGCLLVGTSPGAAADYREVRYREPAALFMGWERKGISFHEQALCDQLVRIPMVGRSDSLNVAVAAGVMLYEVFNQRRSGEEYGVPRARA